jgi:translocator protein
MWSNGCAASAIPLEAPLATSTATSSTSKQVAALAAFLVAAYAAAAVGTVTQGGDVGGTYLALDPPAWAPPPWLFGPVWTVLYALIGVAGWWVWRVAPTEERRGALGLWTAQLVVNAAWPGVFFGLGELGWALAVIVTLDVLVVATIVAVARIARPAAALLVPYLAWILFATALNATLWLGR